MTTTETSTRPEYLGLLNTISIGERNAGVYLKAWAELTPDPELRQVLALVAARETTHGEVFRQRIERLGFAVRDKDDPVLGERLKVYGDAGLSDLQKVRAFPRDKQWEDRIDAIFATLDAHAADESVDALTRDTLRWYVHEERDSRDLLRAAYARVERMATKG
jgi:DNA-binding transcriptional ArsR family regulator